MGPESETDWGSDLTVKSAKMRAKEWKSTLPSRTI